MNSTNQLVLKIMIGIVSIMALIATVIILGGNMYSSSTNGKIIFITLSMVVYGITAAFCYAIHRNQKYIGLAIIGLTVSAIAFFLNLIFVLTESTSEYLLKAMLSFFFLAIGLAHICFLFYVNIQNKIAEVTRTVAVVLVSTFTLLVVVKIFDSWQDLYFGGRRSEDYVRYVMAALLLEFTATLLVALCNQIRNYDPNESLTFSDPPPNPPPGTSEMKDNY